MKLSKIAFGASAAAALVFTAVSASAQLAPPSPKAPAAPAAKSAAPAKPAAAKKAASTSACQGLDQKACGAKATECRWIAAVKRKDGKEVAAYCRSLPKSVKAAPKKVEPKAATPAPKAPAAPRAPAAKAPPAMAK
jgi:hypothetical protein